MFKKLFEMIKEQNTAKAKCPNCSADSELDITKPVATCQYCGGGFENPYYEKYLKRQEAEEREEEEESFDDFEQESFFDDGFNNDSFDDHYEDESLYAVVEKSALFYEGEIPGITFGNARLCDSYEECVGKLKEIARKERGKAFYEKPHQDLRKIKKEHPKGKIIKV